MARLPKPTPVYVNQTHKEILQKYAQKRTAQAHYKQRIKIVLLAHKDIGNNEIARKLGITNTTVRKWRDRWTDAYNELETFTLGVNGRKPTNYQLLEKMLTILSDAPRSGKPAVIPVATKQEIQAMACQKPKDFNVPFTSWTHQLLAKAIVQEKILTTISPRYVGIILKKTNYSPIKANIGFTPT